MNRILSIVVGLLVAGCVTAATPTNQIDVLVQRLNDDKSFWTNGGFPIIPLSSNATPAEVVASAVKTWGFDVGKIKTYKIREVRSIHLNAVIVGGACSAALVESDLGMKVLLFEYGGQKVGWWTRFYDVKDEGPNKLPENIGTNAPNSQH